MIVLRMLGWFLFFCAALFLVRDLTGAFGVDHGLKPKTIGDVFNFFSSADDYEGLVMHDYGRTWFRILHWVFGIWAWVALFIPGLILELIARPRIDKPYKRVSRKSEMPQHHS